MRPSPTQRSFIADAAHELRSPLTAVRLQLQLLERAPDESARDQARSALGAAVERAVHLVSQLLTLARNEPQDARARELVPLPLEEPAAEAVADTHALALVARRRAVARQLRRGPAAAARCAAIARRCASWCAIWSTTPCATRPRRPGRGAHRGRMAPRDGALLQVDDTGPGIPAAERERAFDRFHRRAAAAEEGCGLGLAIVQAIAERHGASVTLADAPAGACASRCAFRPSERPPGRRAPAVLRLA